MSLRRGRWRILLCLLGALCGFSSARPRQEPSSCLKCHSRAEGRAAEVVRLHQSSTHGRREVGCEGCHGGDPSAAGKAPAHALNFVARPDAAGTVAMCGNCHRQPRQDFRLSRHFTGGQGNPRLDCVDCHGAHTVGAAPESFSFETFCAGCHGLEYLPALPSGFQSLLALSDELQAALRLAAERKIVLPAELVEKRKEIRRLTSEIVHPADLKAGEAKSRPVLEQGAGLIKRLEIELKRGDK